MRPQQMQIIVRFYVAALDTAIMIGHVGDGNFHIFTGVDPNKPHELDDIRLLADKVAAKSLELGGTCTGEHGVGLGE